MATIGVLGVWVGVLMYSYMKHRRDNNIWASGDYNENDRKPATQYLKERFTIMGNKIKERLTSRWRSKKSASDEDKGEGEGAKEDSKNSQGHNSSTQPVALAQNSSAPEPRLESGQTALKESIASHVRPPRKRHIQKSSLRLSMLRKRSKRAGRKIEKFCQQLLAKPATEQSNISEWRAVEIPGLKTYNPFCTKERDWLDVKEVAWLTMTLCWHWYMLHRSWWSQQLLGGRLLLQGFACLSVAERLICGMLATT